MKTIGQDKRKNGNFDLLIWMTEFRVPADLVPYLTDGDDSKLTEEKKEKIDVWMERENISIVGRPVSKPYHRKVDDIFGYDRIGCDVVDLICVVVYDEAEEYKGKT